MQRYLIAVFDDREHAEAAVHDLKEAGIPTEEISIAAGKHHHRHLIDRLGLSDTPIFTGSNAEGQEGRQAAGVGARAGAGIGAAVGLIAGIPLFLATGGGAALLVAGSIAAVLGGGVTGAAAGGLAGGLINMGLPAPKAEHVEGKVQGGAIVVSLRADERDITRIESIFNRHDLDEVIITAVGGAVA
jgi:hypothetical protein